MRIYFRIYESNVEDLPPGYQEARYHIIFYIKMGDKLRPKSQMVVRGHNTTTPYYLTYSSLVSQDSSRISLKCIPNCEVPGEDMDYGRTRVLY